ncbi:hypothetical protein BDV24DRAFT_166429 [Aspergillus arachidicola]|uniref:Peptidase S53 activation domain-containing protein n=1 Tax=Aspergillus arachidicola TaxID=656916 RepID=A0A5N6XYF7_9EURO|nr:hypothetical protein BDV24DRAFT_166429 [Aspergillus arachidicola]
MKIARQQLLGHAFNEVSKLRPVGSLAESTPIDVVITLPARNVESRTSLLRDIYDPESPSFRQFLSPREYTEANGRTVVSAPPKPVHITAPAATINRVFQVTLQGYLHPAEDRHFYVPDSDPELTLETPGLQITGLDNFRNPRRAPNLSELQENAVSHLTQNASGSGRSGLHSGGDFRAAYAAGVTSTGRGQVVGILELDGYVESDIRTYEQQNGIPNAPLKNVYLDGYTG